jgi:hypothetical protein
MWSWHSNAFATSGVGGCLDRLCVSTSLRAVSTAPATGAAVLCGVGRVPIRAYTAPEVELETDRCTISFAGVEPAAGGSLRPDPLVLVPRAQLVARAPREVVAVAAETDDAHSGRFAVAIVKCRGFVARLFRVGGPARRDRSTL